MGMNIHSLRQRFQRIKDTLSVSNWVSPSQPNSLAIKERRLPTWNGENLNQQKQFSFLLRQKSTKAQPGKHVINEGAVSTLNLRD